MRIVFLLLLIFTHSQLVGAEEEHEQSSSVGPEKGILQKSDEGFVLSPEALKTFAFETKPISGEQIIVPKEALVKIKNETSVFRVRKGWFKRVPIEFVTKQNDQSTVKLQDTQKNDQIVLSGVGFLRTIEVFADEGAEHSH